jgi:8-oxo-dGTP diphosphatase
LCGTPLVSGLVEGRERPRCPDCPFVQFENPASAAAGVVIDAQRRVLLVRRKIEPFSGCWALPAGYQEIDEDPRDTVVREIKEESGIDVEVRELFDLLFVLSPHRKPANLAVYLCHPLGGTLAPGHDASEAAWFDLLSLPADLGFDNGPRILHRLRDPNGKWLR